MDKFEEIGKRLDEELTRLRKYVEDEVAPETERRTAQFLREVSEKLAEAPQKLETRVAANSHRTLRRTEIVKSARLRVSSLLLFSATLVGCAGGPLSVIANPLLPRKRHRRPQPAGKRQARPNRRSRRSSPRPAKSLENSLPAPAGYTEEGNASWYGDPFNGRHSSNGEIYDMYKLTAAHRTLPFDTMVLVTNLTNGKIHHRAHHRSRPIRRQSHH